MGFKKKQKKARPKKNNTDRNDVPSPSQQQIRCDNDTKWQLGMLLVQTDDTMPQGIQLLRDIAQGGETRYMLLFVTCYMTHEGIVDDQEIAKEGKIPAKREALQ